MTDRVTLFVPITYPEQDEQEWIAVDVDIHSSSTADIVHIDASEEVLDVLSTGERDLLLNTLETNALYMYNIPATEGSNELETRS